MGGVLVLDDDEDLLATLCELIHLLTGRHCVAARSLAELVALGDAALVCGDAILDINLGPSQPSGLEAFAWLKQKSYGGRIRFLTGHARSHPMVARAGTLDGVEVHQKPLETLELRRMLGAAPSPPSSTPVQP